MPTHEALAAEFKVSPKTVERDGLFAAAVDSLASSVGAEVRQEILAGELPFTKEDVAAPNWR
jgi:predicted DNA-binding transcriptional regulator YafY